MSKPFLERIFGTHHDRERKRLWPTVERVNALEAQMRSLSDAQLKAKTGEFRSRIEESLRGNTFLGPSDAKWYELSMDARIAERGRRRKVEQRVLDVILPEVFAVVREVARRTVNMRHFDVQIMGGMVLHEGRIAEMATGEGKTLVATLAAYLNALNGRGVHLVTVNDYLARRDARWMGPIYHALGLSVGIIQGVDPAERRPGEESLSFIYDPALVTGNDRFTMLRPVSRLEAYQADITYGQNNEFGFDYLRDNMRIAKGIWAQREHHFAIVDEVDSILVDEARTPLIISGPSDESTDLYHRLDKLAYKLQKDTMFEVDEKGQHVSLTEAGIKQSEELLGVANLYDEESMRQVHHIHQALRAHHLFHRDVEYVVKDGEVIIVDEFTGRLMPGRRWSDGLHQAIEAKEQLQIRQENQTLASVTFQNYFRMYEKLSGMTGTASTEAQEFTEIYALDVVPVPTNRPLLRSNHPDIVYKTEEEKFMAVVEEIIQLHRVGQPVLVGTISIDKSEKLSRMLKEPGPIIARLGRTCERTLLEIGKDKSCPQDLEQKMEAGLTRPAQLTEPQVSELLLQAKTKDPKSNLAFRLEDILRLVQSAATVKAGVSHHVLNAKHHEHEAQIIAQAGRKGAVTIATNMAGRGTDILLGGNPQALSEEEIRRIESKEEAQLSDQRRREILDRYMLVCEEERQAVLSVGGLHVLGTERHEARRIDNQLRGRSGRQGDPGSSRFYLSLADDLMRVFGGEKLANMMDMKFFAWEEGLPIESRIVTRSVEHAQRQVEGHNFDIRKHLLEYDNTMNRQREVIYEQRRRIVEGVDLPGLIREIIQDVSDGLVEDFAPAQLRPDAWDLEGLQRVQEQQFGILAVVDSHANDRNVIYDVLLKAFTDAYEAKTQELGSEAMPEIERRVLLATLDRKWKDHLYMMDALREGIGLRAYGQRNPVVEYQREAYQMFQDMTGSIKTDALTLLLRVQPAGQTRPVSVFAQTPRKELHPEFSDPLKASAENIPPGAGIPGLQRQSGHAAPQGGSHAQRGVPVRQGQAKVGRNDPCPCGSGKKYKKCHGG